MCEKGITRAVSSGRHGVVVPGLLSLGPLCKAEHNLRFYHSQIQYVIECELSIITQKKNAGIAFWGQNGRLPLTSGHADTEILPRLIVDLLPRVEAHDPVAIVGRLPLSLDRPVFKDDDLIELLTLGLVARSSSVRLTVVPTSSRNP